MDSAALNTIINDYVSDRLSPPPEQRAYIKKKYGELKIFLNQSCFRSGSYARFTAINPVHDLDVIYIVDPSVYDDPAGFMRQLKIDIEKSAITNIEEVTAQTHSLTITFTDSDTDFAIDVVPALDANEVNEFGQPIYIVPEILEANRYHRQQRYALAATQPVEWIKSDPRGYIKAAIELNKITKNFRHGTKLGKGWRHACKVVYKDDYRLKSFHFELMFDDYFTHHPDATTLDAVTDCMNRISTAIHAPQFRDRADADKFIDQYITDLSDSEKRLLLELQTDACEIIDQLWSAADADEVRRLLDLLLTVRKPSKATAPAATTIASPRQPWAC